MRTPLVAANFLLENVRRAAYIGLLNADMGRYF